jgi:sec-independent protein translocase protein TatA
LIIVLAIVMIVFGAGRLPQVGASMGKALREFRQAVTPGDDDETADKTTDDSPDKTAP